MTDRKERNGPYVIVDVRSSFSGNPYITFWRPNDAGYAYPLSWAGDYTAEQLAENADYYMEHGSGGSMIRFPVLRSIAEKFGIKPAPGMVDGDAGPVVRNIKKNRATLELLRWRPSTPP